MRILAPWDAPSLRHVLREALLDAIPTYIRIGKKGEKDILPISEAGNLGRLTPVFRGETVAIIAVGTVASEAVQAAEELRRLGISATVCLAHTVKPLPEADLRGLFQGHRLIITVEEHSLAAGFGESCISLAYRTGFTDRVLSLGTPDVFLSKAGSQQYARGQTGIDAAAIVGAVRGFFA
jgi:transketolase